MSKNNPALTLFATGTKNPDAPAARDIPIDPWHAILLCAFVLVAVVIGYMVWHNIKEDRRKRARVQAADSRLRGTSQRLQEATTALRMHRVATFNTPTMPMDYRGEPVNVADVPTLADADVWGDVPAPAISRAGLQQRLRVVPSLRT